MAQSSPPPGAAPASSGAPPSVLTAVKLIWVNVALSVLSTIIGFILIDDIVDAATEDVANADADAARTAAIVGLVIGLIIGVAIAALLATFINKGANWARIVYTVLAALGIIFGLLGIANQPALLLVVSLISLVISIAVVFLLFRPESNAYFKQPKFADGSGH